MTWLLQDGMSVLHCSGVSAMLNISRQTIGRSSYTEQRPFFRKGQGTLCHFSRMVGLGTPCSVFILRPEAFAIARASDSLITAEMLQQ